MVASGLSNNVVAIAGGNEFTLVVTSNGQVFAFGNNGNGQLGTNNGGGNVSSPILVPGIGNAVLVQCPSRRLPLPSGNAQPGDKPVLWLGRDRVRQVGNGLQAYYGGFGLPPEQDQYTPAQLPFCNACTSCVQLGTSGIFTAQCTGTLRLYFNDDYEYEDNGGSYTVTITGLTNNVTVAAIASNGVAVGIVSDNATYSYIASGSCTYAQGSCSYDRTAIRWGPTPTAAPPTQDRRKQSALTPKPIHSSAGSNEQRPICPITIHLDGRIAHAPPELGI